MPGKSHALNSALPRVESDLVAFVDDDHRVDAGYLVAVCRAAEAHPEADLFCGRILPDWDGSEPAWVHDSGPYRIYPLPVPRFDQGDASRELTPDQAVPGGGNLFLRTPWLAARRAASPPTWAPPGTTWAAPRTWTGCCARCAWGRACATCPTWCSTTTSTPAA